MNRSLYLTTVLGIPIEINYTWFIVFFLFTWTLAQNYFPGVMPGAPLLLYWMISVLAAVLLFAALLAHELSHSYVAIKNDLPINGITLFIFGGVAHLSREPQSPEIEFKMAIAGPLCSFFISFVFYLLTYLFSNIGAPQVIIQISSGLAMINLFIALFNLIPGFPLDGGRVLRSALWSIYGDLKKATKIATNLGKGFAYFLMALGFLYLMNRMVITGIWFMFIGFFLQDAASTTYQQIIMKNSLMGTKVKEIMSKNIVNVRENVTLLSLVDDYFFKYRFTSFPVVLSGDNGVCGIITIHSVKDIPRSQWATKHVSDAMIFLREDLLVDPSADVFEALRKMSSNRIGRLLVINEQGKLVGYISQRDVMRLFEVKADLEE